MADDQDERHRPSRIMLHLEVHSVSHRWLAVILTAVIGFVLGILLGLIVIGIHSDNSGSTPALTPASSTSTPAERVTEATLNLWILNRRPRADLRRTFAAADLVRLQEITTPSNRRAVAAILSQHPHWRAYWPRRTGQVIAWNTRRFTGAGPGGALLATGRVPVAGRLLPRAWTTWKPLRVVGTEQLLQVVNVHALAGACTGEAGARQPLTEIHWQTLRGATAAWTTGGRTVLLGGDLNCPLWDRAPYTAAGVLGHLYGPDRAGGRDHLLTSRGAPIRTLRRWVVPAMHSDHRLELRRLELRRRTPAVP